LDTGLTSSVVAAEGGLTRGKEKEAGVACFYAFTIPMNGDTGDSPRLDGAAGNLVSSPRALRGEKQGFYLS
jgi:hypothetical protein